MRAAFSQMRSQDPRNDLMTPRRIAEDAENRDLVSARRRRLYTVSRK